VIVGVRLTKISFVKTGGTLVLPVCFKTLRLVEPATANRRKTMFTLRKGPRIFVNSGGPVAQIRKIVRVPEACINQ
jgi:hypothetical protein